MKYWIGIDNGVTGTIAVIDSTPKLQFWSRTPTYEDFGPYKTKKIMRKIDFPKLIEIIEPYKACCFVLVEYPYIHPKNINTTCSAMQSHTTTEIALKYILKVPYHFIPSSDWQKALLPKGCTDTELKNASRDVAKRLFPDFKLPGGVDGDAIGIAEYGRRQGF